MFETKLRPMQLVALPRMATAALKFRRPRCAHTFSFEVVGTLHFARSSRCQMSKFRRGNSCMTASQSLVRLLEVRKRDFVHVWQKLLHFLNCSLIKLYTARTCRAKYVNKGSRVLSNGFPTGEVVTPVQRLQMKPPVLENGSKIGNSAHLEVPRFPCFISLLMALQMTLSNVNRPETVRKHIHLGT